jgi:VRR-NUC domain-containing protein
MRKHDAANAKLATAAVKARIALRPPWRCQRCGKQEPATVHRKRNKYCSYDCMSAVYQERMRGASNPNFRDAGKRACLSCGVTFKSYSNARKYCSMVCRDTEFNKVRTRARKDNNHNAVVGLLQDAGAGCMDASFAGQGMPDLLVWWRGAWHLVEVKNPNTAYGRKGLSPRQRRWAENWNGGPVYVIRTGEDVASFLNGDLLPAVRGRYFKNAI